MEVQKDFKIGFVGDLMFGDQPITFGYGLNSRHSRNSYSEIFKGINNYLQKSDVVVGNFESVIRNSPVNPSVTNYSMCCDENIALQLFNSNIRIVSLANNHTMDYGEEGYYNTRSVLEQGRISIIGDKERPWTIVTLDGKEKVGVFAASYIRTTSSDPCYLYFPNRKTLKGIIDDMQRDGAVKIIAYIHWGNEFVEQINQMQLDMAKQMTQLGVDIIVGCHSHILQKACYINDIPVFFSIGNFVSDYWQRRLRKTEIIVVDFNEEESSIIRESCLISKYGCPMKIEENVLEIQNTVMVASKYQINRARWQMRFEYLLKLTINFHRVRNKIEMIKWFKRRLNYLFGFLHRELTDPDVIYEHYEN